MNAFSRFWDNLKLNYRNNLADIRRIRGLGEYYAKINGYAISMEERKRRRIKRRELIYGNTPLNVFSKLLKIADAKSDDIFYDLGCGIGAPALFAAGKVKRVVGMDCLKGMVEASKTAAKHLNIKNAKFIHGDIRKVDLSEATLAFVTATTFPEELVNTLAQKTSSMQSGSRIISVTRNLKVPHLKFIRCDSYKISWSGKKPRNRTSYYFYERI